MTEKIREKLNSPIMDQVVRGVVLLVIPWSIWVTQSIYQAMAFQQRGDRFSAKDGHRLETLILQQTHVIQREIHQLESEMTEEFVRHSELKTVIDGLRK